MIRLLCICLLLTGCAAPGVQRAVIFDAANDQIVAAEFPNGSTVKFDGPIGKLEVIAPVPKASIIEDITKGMSAVFIPMLPLLMIDAMDDD